MLGEQFFTSSKIEERTVEMGDGTQHVLWFRHLTNVEVERVRIAMRSADDEVAAGAFARMVSLSLCEPDGKPAISYDQASRLKPDVMDRIVDAALDLNGLKKKPAAAADSSS